MTAHPDDETLFGGAVYKLSHSHGGQVDLAVLTRGEGGYRAATLAEPLYGLKLTDPEVARVHLARIREQELRASARILGLRECVFLDQPDPGFTIDAAGATAIEGWDTDFIRRRLGELLLQGRYDFLFVMLPLPLTHSHHRASALLALEVVAGLAPHERPLVLGTSGHTRRRAVAEEHRQGFPIPEAEDFSYAGVPGQPRADVRPGCVFEFDRTRRFGFRDRLDYNIVVDWAIAEHKTQGVMQLRRSAIELERYWYFALNLESGAARVQALFERLAEPPRP
ncbi:MAG: PIG-L family deacetylase [Myxococcaceae bacterium]|nr:PIG-L family deacetylase [Myxococcaceae bacterium]